MQMKLTPLQTSILSRLGTDREMPFDHLVRALTPTRAQQGLSPVQWEEEIRLQIDLLGVYGVIQITPQLGSRLCVAPEFVVRWADMHRVRQVVEGRKYKPSIVLPLVAATLLSTVTAGCSSFPWLKQDQPAPVVSRYNPDGTPPPERMEQFYNARTGNLVYRFCVEDECPLPTPKIPVQKASVVNEINPDGSATPVEQKLAANETAPTHKSDADTRKAIREALNTPKTAANNPTAAAIAAQLAAQRSAILGAGNAEQAPAVPMTTPKPTMKKVDLSPTPTAAPTAHPEPAPTGKPTSQGVLPMQPSTNTRIPSGPAADASMIDVPLVAMAAGGMLNGGAAVISHNLGLMAVGGMSTAVLVTQTPETFGGQADARSPEALLSVWAGKWSAKDADGYFNLYASDFTPSYGPARSLSHWARQRRTVMGRPGAIKVSAEVVKIDERDGKATVSFWQTFESRSFKSRVLKSMELVKAGDAWKIHRERLVPVEMKDTAA